MYLKAIYVYLNKTKKNTFCTLYAKCLYGCLIDFYRRFNLIIFCQKQSFLLQFGCFRYCEEGLSWGLSYNLKTLQYFIATAAKCPGRNPWAIHQLNCYKGKRQKRTELWNSCNVPYNLFGRSFFMTYIYSLLHSIIQSLIHYQWLIITIPHS